MPTIQAKYNGGLRTESQHIQSGNKLITDAPLDNNGKGEAFSPTDLLAAALGSCMMTIMAITAQKNNIELAETTYEITKIMSANPRKVQEVIISFKFPELNISDELKQKFENAAHTCPVSLSLSKDVIQNITFNW